MPSSTSRSTSAASKTSPARTHGAHVGLVGHITLDELRRELAAVDARSGFANRFIWAVARRSKFLPDGGVIPDGHLQAPAQDIERAISFAKTSVVLKRDREASELWHTVYPSLSDGVPGLLGAVTSRAESQVLRLSVIYAALDCSDVIRREHLMAALAVWDYSYRSAAYIFGDSEADPIADRILLELRRAFEQGLARSAMYGLFDRHVTAEQIDLALVLSGIADLPNTNSSQAPAVRRSIGERQRP